MKKDTEVSNLLVWAGLRETAAAHTQLDQEVGFMHTARQGGRLVHLCRSPFWRGAVCGLSAPSVRKLYTLSMLVVAVCDVFPLKALPSL